MDDLINKTGSSEFNPKYKINNLMLDRLEEIRKETIDIWVRVVLGLGCELNSNFVQSQNIQLPKDKQLVDKQTIDTEKLTSTQLNTIVPVTESHFEIEDTPIDNVQIEEDTQAHVNKFICTKDTQVLDEVPSGKSTNAQDIEDTKFISLTDKGKETVVDLSFGLAIDTYAIAKGNLQQISTIFDKPYHYMSPIENILAAATLQAHATQELTQEESKDRKLIEHNFEVLHQLVQNFMHKMVQYLWVNQRKPLILSLSIMILY